MSGVVVIFIVRILLAMWMFAALAVALLSGNHITGQSGDQQNDQDLQCNGNDKFPTSSGRKYCTYYYNFSGDDCGSASKFQGHGVARGEYDDLCGPLSLDKHTVIICFCSKHHCNTLKNVQKMMRKPMTEIYGVSGYGSTADDKTKILFDCMKRDIDKKVEESKKARKKDRGLPISVGLLVGIVVGSVLLIGTIVVLIPFLRKWHKARHKKWLEETWEERVRQAAKELNVQNSKEAGEPEKAKYDKKTRAGRKALKTLIESRKEGSKESQEKGSKDDLFPMAIGPNEQRLSAEKFSAEAGKGSAEAGGFPDRGPGGFGAPGRGFSNEAQGMGVQ